jgi:hypothetical protein
LKKIFIVLIVLTVVNLNFFHWIGELSTRRIALVSLTILWIFKPKKKYHKNIKGLNILIGSILVSSIIMSIIQNTISDFNYQLLQLALTFYSINIINFVIQGYNLRFEPKDLILFSKVSFILIIIYCSYIYTYEPINLKSLYFLRELSATSTNVSLNIILNMVVQVFTISIYSFAISKGLNKIILVGINILFFSIILLSFSRQSVFAVLVVLILFLIHFQRKSKWIFLILFTLLVVIFIDEILILFEAFANRFGTSGDSKRAFAYINGLKTFINNPWGVGLGNYTLLNKTNFNVLESGNLQILVELGLIYSFVFLIGFIRFYRSVKFISHPILKRLVFSLTIITILLGFFNEIILNSFTFLPLFFFYTLLNSKTPISNGT